MANSLAIGRVGDDARNPRNAQQTKRKIVQVLDCKTFLLSTRGKMHHPRAMLGIYTSANNRMLPFLRVWLGAIRANNPELPVCVLPFGEEVSEVKGFCERANIQYFDGMTEAWIQLGWKLYGDDTYRANTPRAWYLSKMAAFNGPFETFVFVDANAIVLNSLAGTTEKFVNSDYDILYGFRADEFRNIKNAAIRDELNKLCPTLKNGYNANFFISRRNCMTLEKCVEMVDEDPNLADKFGTAVEQGIMTYYIAMQGLKAATIKKVCPPPSGASCRHDLTVSPEGEIRREGSPALFIKWNGSKIGPDMPNFEIFSMLQSKYGISVS